MNEAKNVAFIILVASILFMGLAIFQEWSLFEPLFVKAKVTPAEKLPEEVASMLDNFNAMTVHFYASAGDERFLQRVPASDRIKEEFFIDVAYLNDNLIVQVMKPDAVKISSFRKIKEGKYIVETDEEWLLHYEDMAGNRFDPQEKDFRVLMRYYCEKGPEGYRVARMEPRRDG